MTHDEQVMETLYKMVNRIVDEEIEEQERALREAIEEANVNEKESY